MNEKSRSEYSIINILTGFGGYFFNVLIGYICRIFFVRCLNADYLGINGLFTNILSMLSLAELGIGGAIGFALYKPIAEHDEDKIASYMQLYGKAYRIIGITVGVFGLLMMPFLRIIITTPPNISENIYVIYLVYLFNTASSYFFSYRASLITAAQKNFIVLGVNYLCVIIASMIQIPILLLTHNYMAYLIVQTLSTFFNNFIISYVAKKMYPFITNTNVKPLSKNEKKSLFINVKALTINKLSSTLVNNTDNIVITYLNGLISVGVIPPNPAELLLEREKMNALFSALRERYDYIILDCPPIDIVTDSNIIKEYTDITLFVVRAGVMDRRSLSDVEELYKNENYKHMAIVLNGTTYIRNRYGNYKYGYSYGYAAGYYGDHHENS